MEWLKRLDGCVIGLDTAPLIYFMEENPDYIGTVAPFFEAFDRGEFSLVTSTVTLAEVLVRPFRMGVHALADEYRELILRTDGLDTLPVSPAIAELAAKLRADHGLRTPDAIQVATALHAGATAFLTNDARIPAISGISILVLDKLRT